ncbi:MAG: OmpA family protein [Bdellovibrionota bacterium]
MKKFLCIALSLVLSFNLSGCSLFGSSSGSDDGMNGNRIDSISEQELNSKFANRFGDGSVPSAEGNDLFRDLRFGYDSSKISDASRQDLDYNIEILKSNPNIYVQLEGHCDERGTAEYNMALGEKRANSVYEALVMYGIAPNRLTTISYGEEVPLDNGQTEEAYAKNRRVHFSAYTK